MTEPDLPHRDLLVWTTTPWTLPANLLIAARADLEYSVVRLDPEHEVVLASVAVARHFPDRPEVVERFPGSALSGRRYSPPFDSAGGGPGRYRIVLDDFVTAEDGTGFVHVAPSFGPDDQRVGAREQVGVFDPLDNRGVFGEAVPRVRGKTFKAADPLLVEDLAERGLLFRSETIRHTYPFCWRCDTPLLYRAIDSWFVRTSRFTQALQRNNAGVRWIPAHLREGRFGNFLTEAKDWALSRNRYWGTPLPIWLCPAGHPTCVGSFTELVRLTGAPLPAGFDPHRVHVDRIVFPCPKCAAPSRREPYTIDAWYDSGSAPFAQFHYPFEPGPFSPDAPLDYVSEGLDQTRGWFYSLLVLSTALFSRPAYRTSLTTGMVLDDSGRKMSKSKGNVLDPLQLLERVGADPIRWTFLSIDFTEPMRVGETTIHKAAARTLGTLTNLVAFHLENARPDGLDPAVAEPTVTSLLDRWALTRLEATRQAVSTALDEGDPRPAALAVRELVDDLSTWYVRRSRPRFWGDTSPADRRAAHDTLSYVLLGVARITAPLIPFTAEWVHHEVGEHEFEDAEDSVHLARWPDRLASRDPELEAGMAQLRELVEVGRELRHRAEVKARIPLAEIRPVRRAEPAPRAAGNRRDDPARRGAQRASGPTGAGLGARPLPRTGVGRSGGGRPAGGGPPASPDPRAPRGGAGPGGRPAFAADPQGARTATDGPYPGDGRGLGGTGRGGPPLGRPAHPRPVGGPVRRGRRGAAGRSGAPSVGPRGGGAHRHGTTHARLDVRRDADYIAAGDRLGEDIGLEAKHADPRVAPGRGREAGLLARPLEELLRGPPLLGADLRQQQPARAEPLDEEAIPSDQDRREALHRADPFDRLGDREDRHLDGEPRELLGEHGPEARVVGRGGHRGAGHREAQGKDGHRVPDASPEVAGGVPLQGHERAPLVLELGREGGVRAGRASSSGRKAAFQGLARPRDRPAPDRIRNHGLERRPAQKAPSATSPGPRFIGEGGSRPLLCRSPRRSSACSTRRSA